VSDLTPEGIFHAPFYLRHNQRRLEHLASLRLPLREKSVLEVGAGIGDHTGFFVDRNCDVTSLEVREENLRILKERYPHVVALQFDMDDPGPSCGEYDIVYCYGLLYHLKNPGDAIRHMAACCRGMLLLETCVSYGQGKLINACIEDVPNPSQAFSGIGCRPTRDWVQWQLKQNLEYVYLTLTQPNHEEFPTDWTTAPPDPNLLSRAVFIGSRSKLCNDQLTETIPMIQSRH
jgi:2-polyprenyl-3-methyl-5-hydroxy-6-metoxy-1,4-benzoquinol methylase